MVRPNGSVMGSVVGLNKRSGVFRKAPVIHYALIPADVAMTDMALFLKHNLCMKRCAYNAQFLRVRRKQASSEQAGATDPISGWAAALALRRGMASPQAAALRRSWGPLAFWASSSSAALSAAGRPAEVP